MSKDALDELRDANGNLPAYAWPGGYPLYYMTKDGGVLCPSCANEYVPSQNNENQLKPVFFATNWEDPNLFCEHCNKRIESAYAEPEETK